MLKRSLIRIIIVILMLGLISPVWAADELYNGFQIVHVVVNGKPLTSDVPAVVMDGRTVLPLRAVAEATGLDVRWDPTSSTAYLTSKEVLSNSASLSSDNERLRSQLSQAQAENAKLASELVSVKADNTQLAGELSQIKADLAKTQSEKAALQKALGSTPATNGDTISLSALPVTVSSDNGMVLTVNKVLVTGSTVTFNITLKNTGGATGDSMFSSTDVQAGSSKLKFLSQDKVFYDGFLSFYPGLQVDGNVTFGGVPAGTRKITWYFTLQAGSDWDKKQLTFEW
jgi:hypothetical protein